MLSSCSRNEARTLGQSLDSEFNNLKANISMVWQFSRNLENKYDQVITDLKTLNSSRSHSYSCSLNEILNYLKGIKFRG